MRRVMSATAALLVALAAVAVLTGMVQVTTVAGESMTPTYETGDLAIGTPGTPEVGDVITYTSDMAEANGSDRVIHRVTKVTENGYITVGDGNHGVEDPEVPAENVESVVRVVIPEAGLWMRSPLVIGPGCAAAALALLWPSATEQDEEREKGHVEE